MIHIKPDDRSIVSCLYPYAQVNSSWDIRIGILTIRQKWELFCGEGNVLFHESTVTENGIPGNFIPDAALVKACSIGLIDASVTATWRKNGGLVLERPNQIFEWNDYQIRQDFSMLTNGRNSATIPDTVTVIQPENIFIEEGARLQHCLLNGATGPIYIGKHAEIMEGSFIRGPFALCEGAVIKMGTKIYGATTIGPYCIAGGEIKNAVLMGYSNKAHDGYLGDSVIGEWCNIGAGTSNSNIKNTAAPVSIWNKATQQFTNVGPKCGLLMGDYSRAAINTSFNTGTVVGICSNVFGEGLTPKLIPDFSWGAAGNSRYKWDKALRDITNWKKLKNKTLTDREIQKLKTIFEGN